MVAQNEGLGRERSGRRRTIAITVISVLGLVLLAGLILSLFRWVIGLLLLAALGYAIWYFVGPRIRAAFQKMRAGRQQRQAREEARRAEAARQQNIERTLEELKRDMKSD
jgi:hypothetical protein